VIATALPGVLVLQPKVFRDRRGFFFESFNARGFKAATGLDRTFAHDNQSHSITEVLRRLHYQIEQPWPPKGVPLLAIKYANAKGLKDAALDPRIN